MFKTRAGDTVRLASTARRGRRARRLPSSRAASPTATPPRARALAPQIGIGAVKYADLSNDRIKDYVFDWDRMLAAEGRTGPYLQYAHARIHSIFRKAAEAGVARATAAAAIALGEPAERALALELLDFGSAVLEAAESLRPHRLVRLPLRPRDGVHGVLRELPGAAGAGRRDARVAARAVRAHGASVLARGLDLLGIAAPERM